MNREAGLRWSCGISALVCLTSGVLTIWPGSGHCQEDAAPQPPDPTSPIAPSLAALEGRLQRIRADEQDALPQLQALAREKRVARSWYEAIHVSQRIAQWYPDTTAGRRALLDAGWSYLFGVRDFPAARDVYDNITETYPGTPEEVQAHYYLGLLFVGMPRWRAATSGEDEVRPDELETARKHLEWVHNHAPDSIEGQWARVHLYWIDRALARIAAPDTEDEHAAAGED